MRGIYDTDRLGVFTAFLYPDFIRDPVKLESFFVIAAVCLGQMLPQLGVLLSGPFFHLVLPVLIWDGIVEQTNPTARKSGVSMTRHHLFEKDSRCARRGHPDFGLHLVDSLRRQIKLTLSRQCLDVCTV